MLEPWRFAFGHVEEIDGRVVCHVCGRTYKWLPTHTLAKHDLSADGYRRRFGLSKGQTLSSPGFFAVKSQATHAKRDAGIFENFEKGHARRPPKDRATGPHSFQTRRAMSIAKGGTGAVGKLPVITEKEFMRQVMDVARLFGWEHYHAWLSIHSPRGWPDLALCRPPRLILAELKREAGILSPSQDKWLALLRACPGIETYLWRPPDIDAIAEILR